MKIALLEDDAAQSEMVYCWLKSAGHDIEAYANGESLLENLSMRHFDVMIFDWQLPDRDGIEILTSVRKNYDSRVPVLFTTQRDSEQDIVRALEQGADDYLVKPLRQSELLARISALGRRAGVGQIAQKITVGHVSLDKSKDEASVNGEPVKLTEKEFQVAQCLLENEGRLLSREYLLDHIWGIKASLNTRTVDIHVSKVRRELKLSPEMGYRVKTIYQHGYRFEKI